MIWLPVCATMRNRLQKFDTEKSFVIAVMHVICWELQVTVLSIQVEEVHKLIANIEEWVTKVKAKHGEILADPNNDNSRCTPTNTPYPLPSYLQWPLSDIYLYWYWRDIVYLCNLSLSWALLLCRFGRLSDTLFNSLCPMTHMLTPSFMTHSLR